MRGNPNLRQIINRHCNTGRRQLLPDNPFNFPPLAPGKSRTDPWHVNRGMEFFCLRRHTCQALANRFITYRRKTALETHSMLPDQIGNPNCVLNLNELNLTKCERLRFLPAMPSSITPFRLGPSSGNRNNEPFSPPARVVADMHNNFRTVTGWPGRVADFIRNVHVFFSSKDSSSGRTTLQRCHLVLGASMSRAGSLVHSGPKHIHGRAGCGACAV